VSGEILLRYGEILAIVLISAGYNVDSVPLDKAINEKMVYHTNCINACNTFKLIRQYYQYEIICIRSLEIRYFAIGRERCMSIKRLVQF
jgi:hypothetical protein